MRKFLYAGGLLVLLCPAASAMEWVKIGSAPNGTALYFDRDATHYEAERVRDLDRIVFAAPQTLSGDKPVQYVEVRGHHEIDCLARTVSNLDAMFYDAAGNLVQTTTLGGKPIALTPQSSSWAVARQFCQSW